MSTVLHASGFVHDNRPTSIRVTSYEGDLETVVPGIIRKIESQGHGVKVWRTKPLGDWWLVAVDLEVLVRDSDSVMWHHFAYPSDQWERLDEEKT